MNFRSRLNHGLGLEFVVWMWQFGIRIQNDKCSLNIYLKTQSFFVNVDFCQQMYLLIYCAG